MNMNVHEGQKVRVWYSDGRSEVCTVIEINDIGFKTQTTVNGWSIVQFKSDGVEYMQGIGHSGARRVEIIPSFHGGLSDKLHEIRNLAESLGNSDDIVTITMRHLVDTKNDILKTVQEAVILLEKAEREKK